MYPHSQRDEMHDRFSLTKRYQELRGRNAHRLDNDFEEAPKWESDHKLNMSTNELDRIFRERPANKRYALIPWKMVDRMDKKAYATKQMIELHRMHGYTIVPAARHRKANLVSDRVYRQLDSWSALDRHSEQEEVLHDQAIVIEENIVMERDLDEHNRYTEMLREENAQQYRDIGPNGRSNDPRINDRFMKMQYLKEDDAGMYTDPSTYLYDKSHAPAIAYGY